MCNLQKTILLDTPLGLYLKENDVHIDIEEKKIKYMGKIYDISKEHKGFSTNEKERALEFVIYKLFVDYQINAFFAEDNVLDYGGGVRYRPEFLYNLSELLSNKDIEYNWLKQNNKLKCYVIKFKADLSKFDNSTFNIKDYDYDQGVDFIELVKRKWLVKEILRVIHDDMFYSNINECFSYLKLDVLIPYSDIIDIYSEKEYELKYLK